MLHGWTCSCYFLGLDFLCNIHSNVIQNKYLMISNFTKLLYVWYFALIISENILFTWKLRTMVCPTYATTAYVSSDDYLSQHMIFLIVGLKCKMIWISCMDIFFFLVIKWSDLKIALQNKLSADVCTFST